MIENEDDQYEIRVPGVGDQVICKYEGFQYFAAIVTSIDIAAELYEVKWDDGDSDNLYHRLNSKCAILNISVTSFLE